MKGGGLDISARRYQGKNRYQLEESAFLKLPALLLDLGWEIGDGLWMKVNGSEFEENVNYIFIGQGDGTDNNNNALVFPDNKETCIMSADFALANRDTSDSYTRFHTNYIGFYLRYQDANNFVRVDTLEAYRPAGYQFIRLLLREEGNFISIKNIPIKNFNPDSLFEDWHQLKVSNNAETVIVWLDGMEILRANYETSVPVGRKGFLSNIATQALFKNLSISQGQ